MAGGFRVVKEHPGHFEAEGSKGTFRIAKKGLHPKRVESLQRLCRGGEVKPKKMAEGGPVMSTALPVPVRPGMPKTPGAQEAYSQAGQAIDSQRTNPREYLDYIANLPADPREAFRATGSPEGIEQVLRAAGPFIALQPAYHGTPHVWRRQALPDDQYLYHVTPESNVPAINREGLRPDAPKIAEGGPHGGTRAVFLAEHDTLPTYQDLYGPETVTFRVPRSALADLEEDAASEGAAWMSKRTIPASLLEVERDGKWAPLAPPQKKAHGGKVKGNTMDLSRVALVRDTPEAWHLKDDKGEFRVDKAGVAKGTHDQIVQHFAEGGEVASVSMPLEQAMGRTTVQMPLESVMPATLSMPLEEAMQDPYYREWQSRVAPGPDAQPTNPQADLPITELGGVTPAELAATNAEAPPTVGPPAPAPEPTVIPPQNWQAQPVHEPERATVGVPPSLMRPPGQASAPPMPSGGGHGGQTAQVQQQIEEGFAQQQAAAAALANNATAEADAVHKAQQDIEQRRAAIQGQWDGQWKAWQAQGDQLKQSIMDQKIDPKRLWNEAGTGGRISAAIGMILGGLGAGMTRGPNYAMQVIERSIDRDLDAQKAELGKKESLLNAHMQEGHSLQAAHQLARADLLDAAAGQMALVASKYAGPKAQAIAQAQSGQLSVAAAQARQNVAAQGVQMAMHGLQMESAKLDIYQKQRMNPLLLETAQGQVEDARRQRALRDAVLANPAQAKPADVYRAQGYPEGQIIELSGNRAALAKGSKAEDWKPIREGLSFVQEARANLKTLDALQKKPGSSVSIEDRATAEVTKAALIGALRLPITGPGAMSEQERKMLSDIIADPTAIWSLSAANRAKLRALEKVLNTKESTILGNYTVGGGGISPITSARRANE